MATTRLAGDRPPPDDQVAVHQAGELARGRAVDRLGELDGQPAVQAGLLIA